MIDTVTCPSCDAEDLRGVRFCPHCGTGLGGNGVTPAVHAPLVRLLTEVAELEKALLHQFEKGQRSQAQQFNRAITAQTESLRSTLDHHSKQSDRLQVWQKWTAVLAVAVVLLTILVLAIAG